MRLEDEFNLLYANMLENPVKHGKILLYFQRTYDGLFNSMVGSEPTQIFAEMRKQEFENRGEKCRVLYMMRKIGEPHKLDMEEPELLEILDPYRTRVIPYEEEW